MRPLLIAVFVGASICVGAGGLAIARGSEPAAAGFQREVLAFLTKMSGSLGNIERNTTPSPEVPIKPPPPKPAVISPLMVSFVTNDSNAPFQPIHCSRGNCKAAAEAFCDDMGYDAVTHVQTMGSDRLTGMICYVAHK